MNPMSLLNQLHRWVGESRRNQLLAAGAALVAVGLAAVGVVLALSGDGDREEEVVARTATPSPAADVPCQESETVRGVNRLATGGPLKWRQAVSGARKPIASWGRTVL